MEKSEKDIDEVAALLEHASVKQDNRVTFKGRGLKLNEKEDALEIVNSIENCKDLQVFEMVGNTVGVAAAESIANALKKKPELERCLWADMFTGRLRSEIPKSLRFLSNAIMEAQAHLVELDLSDNAFGPDGVNACVELLRSPACYTLQELRFNNNGLGRGGVIIAETLLECHKRSSSAGKSLALKTFIAGRNRLENPGAKALAKAFQTLGSLEEIQLPQNGIQHEGISALAQAVKHSPNLRHLNLNDNTFTEKGSVAMADGIANINSLEIINFGDCLVRTEGAKAIAKALKGSNPNLKHVVLSFGEIQLEGGLKVCEVLSSKQVLEVLDLNGNQFGMDGVEEVKDLAREFQRPDALEPLSDDEGSVSGSDTESDSDVNDSTDRDVSDIVNDSVRQENGSLQTNGDSIAHVLTAKNFLSSVTPASLVSLSETARGDIVEEVAELVTDAESTADALATLAGLLNEDCLKSILECSEPKAEVLRNAVFQCVDVLTLDALEKYPNTPMLVLNALLVRMGLIKSEDKKFKAPEDIRDLVVVFGHMCQQPYFPQFTKSLVRGVVLKENKIWDKSPVLRTQLIRLLYS